MERRPPARRLGGRGSTRTLVGRDAFHRVPIFDRRDRDGVESVPTGLKRVTGSDWDCSRCPAPLLLAIIYLTQFRVPGRVLAHDRKDSNRNSP